MGRKEKKFHFIYKTINLLNSKYYFGMHSTDDLNDGYMGSGKRLRYSVNKHGKENHIVEIVEFLSDRKSLANREKEIVCLNEIAKDKCMNLKIGGRGGLDGLSDEILVRIHEGASNFLKNKWKNDEYRKKISGLSSERMIEHHKNHKIKYDTFTDKKHSVETKKLMSESHKGLGIGEKNSQHGTCWIVKNEINKKIKKQDISFFLSEGWIKGRKINARFV